MDQARSTVAIFGCGKMGEILGAGMIRSGVRSPEQILVTDIDPSRVAEAVARHGFVPAAGNSAAVQEAATLVIAVKPKDMGALLDEISSAVSADHLIISIAAGITTAFIQDRLGSRGAVVRAMPNAAAQVGEGMTAICAGSASGADQLGTARELLEGVGPVIEIGEPYMDAVTAVSGSGPAYFALFAEALVDAGVTIGLPREVSATLTAQTLRGAASLMTDGGMQPVEVRAAVTSPGGTTAMAVRELERAGVRAAVLDAVQAAFDRSRELAAGSPMIKPGSPG